MNKSIEKAFNEQINAEIFSAYLYLSMAAYFDSKSLQGMSLWMKYQAQEEMTHAMKFYDFIFDRGGKVDLKEIKKPQSSWESPLNVFEEALLHEKKVTSLINDLVALSDKEKDYASKAFLQWFVTEQVEEEASASEIVDKLKLINDHPSSLFILDKELALRKAPGSENK